MGINKSFWTNKKVLVTGHTGFKGAWLSAWLRRLGADVLGIAKPPSTVPNLHELTAEHFKVNSIFGDIRDLDFLKGELTNFNPDIIIHMAAQAIVRQSYDDPIETFQTNVMGTANLLEAARSVSNLRAFLSVTSDKCYENREWHWKYREIDPMGGWDPYSASKGCAELVTSSFRRSFFNPDKYDEHGVAVATARAGNVIGGGDWSRDRLIPDTVRAFNKNKEVIIRSPAAVRPWQFILDLLNGYILLTERLFTEGRAYAEPWNFGPDDEAEKSVEYILKQMIELWGEGAKWSLDENWNPHEANYLKLDSSKARIRLGWAPKFTLDQSLKYVVDWYKLYYAGGNIIEFTEKQLDEYESL